MELRPRLRKRLVSDINVVPYIDVMLVLLVIFMITAPLLAQGVKVDLPEISSKALDPKSKEPVIVSIDKAGRYYANIATDPNRPLNASDLINQVSAYLKKNQGSPVLLNGDQGVPYGKVVQAMTLLQHAGADSVGLMTKPPSTPKAEMR